MHSYCCSLILVFSLFLSNAVLANLSCNHLFLNSQPSPLNVTISDFDFGFGFGALKSIRPEVQHYFSDLLALEPRLQNNGSIPLQDVIAAYLKIFARANVQSDDPFTQKLIQLAKLIENKDFTLLIETADKLVAEKDFEQWVRMVIMVQRGYIERTDDPFYESPHPTWQDFSQRMGLMAHSKIQDLFQQKVFQWISAKSLRKYFNKRLKNNELDIQSEEDLLALANSFLNSQNSTQIIFQRPDGLIFKYDNFTRELALLSSDGKIITYYILNEDYRITDTLDDHLARTFLGIPYKTEPEAN